MYVMYTLTRAVVYLARPVALFRQCIFSKLCQGRMTKNMEKEGQQQSKMLFLL